MKKLKITLAIIFFSTISLLAQEKTPKWITDKCSAMKEQVKIELQLTNSEADSYYQIMLDKYNNDASKVKLLETDDAKKTYYSESYKLLMTKLKEVFGAEKAQKIQKWTSENQAKFNKPKNQ